MHGDIALNGCECMVNESTLCLVFDWVGLVKRDNVHQSRTILCMINKICARYQQEGIDPPSGEKTRQLWLDIVPSSERP